MHSVLVRAQNVFGFFTTVAFFVAALIALSVVVSPQSPSASLKLRNVQIVKGRPHYYSTKKEEYAHVKFDLDADLSSLFNWNTKQIFLYITTTYPSLSPTEPPSQAIVWDAIIPSTSAPWHQNQYNHPPTKNTASSSSKSLKSTAAFPANASPGIVRLASQRPKYQITDVTGRIAERANATLELGWNVQPWVGALTWTNRRDWGYWKGLVGGRSEQFDFPPLKSKKAEDVGTVKGGEKNRGSPA
ncbi:signal peptidase subunit-domain-containing protein [Cryomyces antarcticus]